jgi:hypothetical protein
VQVNLVAREELLDGLPIAGADLLEQAPHFRGVWLYLGHGALRLLPF